MRAKLHYCKDEPGNSGVSESRRMQEESG